MASKNQTSTAKSADNEESKGGEAAQVDQKQVVKVEVPRLKIDFCGFRASEKPCQIELYLHKTYLHIDKDQISGYLHMKALAPEIQSKIQSVKVQLIQQELQGSTKSLPPPMVGQQFID